MNLDLIGKKALVCGSSQGIGLAAAQELALLGADVTLLARNEQRLAAAQETLYNNGSQSHDFRLADFSSTDEVKKAILEKADFHILINNTGGPPGGLAIDAPLAEFQEAFISHLLNNQLLAQAVIPFMKSQGYGRVINIISTSVKAPLAGLGVSNTIRGAVNSWSKTLANELAGFGITVNNVLPGATRTQRLESIIASKAKQLGVTIEQVEEKMQAGIPAGRFGEAYEVAAAVAFFASPAAAYINGTSITVDGGRTGCF